MTFIDAVLLGTVEGLTEFLPISSTGHLILAGHFLHLEEADAQKAFDVIIQAGAILAVIWHYRTQLWERFRQVTRSGSDGQKLALRLFVAFLPAAITGLLFAAKIKEQLFGVGPVMWALGVGGVLMIVVERFWPDRSLGQPPQEADPRDFGLVSLRQAFAIGCAQCLALWPGMSRSMSTIVGGRVMGLNGRKAAEFSFLLAIPTLLAACLHDLVKHRQSFAAAGPDFWPQLAIGTIVSFISALIVIRIFLRFLQTHSLSVFGWYRIALAVLLALFATQA